MITALVVVAVAVLSAGIGALAGWREAKLRNPGSMWVGDAVDVKPLWGGGARMLLTSVTFEFDGPATATLEDAATYLADRRPL